MSLAEPLSLSDEELVLLNAEHPLVIYPYLDDLDDERRTVAVRTALRSLRLHGMPFDEVTGGLTLPVELVELLQGRSGAQRILFIRKQVHGIEHVRYMHFDGGKLIVEDVSGEGVHTFDIHPAGALHQLVTDYVAVPGSIDAVGAPFAVDASLQQGPWGTILATIDAAVWRAHPLPGAPVLLGAILGDGGTFVSSNELGSGGPVEMTPMACGQLPAAIIDLLGDNAGRD